MIGRTSKTNNSIIIKSATIIIHMFSPVADQTIHVFYPFWKFSDFKTTKNNNALNKSAPGSLWHIDSQL